MSFKNIIFRNGKEYLKIGHKKWNTYLNEVAPYRKYDINIKKCSLRDKNVFWCNTCNTGIGSWKNSCVHIISSLNLVRYSDILREEEIDENNHYEIEIDRNDNKSTI
jgi:hypothetical protein